MSIKNRIQAAFNKAKSTYDAAAQLQHHTALYLVNLLKSRVRRVPHIMVDLGCGTGISTACLMNDFSYQSLYGIDFSEALIQQARLKSWPNHVQFQVNDFDEAHFSPNTVDVLYSNMAFQWSLSLARTFQVAYVQLKPAGVLACAFPLSGSLPELPRELKNPCYTREAVHHAFEQLSFNVLVSEIKTYVEYFASPKHALLSLKYRGANCLLKQQPRPAIQSFDANTLTYKIGFFVVEKPTKN